MRRPERIPIVLDIMFASSDIIGAFTGSLDTTELFKNREGIEEYWKENYDQRFGQVLINLELCNDNLSLWNKEEVEWLISNGYCKVEDISFWGNSFDKDNNRLPETRYILLKDITDSHIDGILDYYQGRLDRLNPDYLKYFEGRINAASKEISDSSNRGE